MDPTSFQFMVTMPGDTRLVEMIRGVVAQAASYANLAAADSAALTSQVQEATAAAIAATGIQDAPIEFEFSGTAEAVRVVITWPSNGSRERRELRQPLSA